jgi:hypothetical protein
MRAFRTIALVLTGGILVGQLPAQTTPTLPAVFYEVEAREIIGFGRATLTPANRGTQVATSSNIANSTGTQGERMFVGGESVGAAQFTVTGDTVFRGAGPNALRIPVRSIVRVDEVSRAEGFGFIWAKIVYRVDEDERELYVRRIRVQRQDDILAALRLAVERAAAAP